MTFINKIIAMFIGLVIIIAASHFGGKAYYYNKYKPAIREGSRVEYAIHVEYKDRIITVPKLIAKIDTVHTIDSVYYEKPIMIAYADTTLAQDSSQVRVKYYFPPANFFQVEAKIKEKVITQKLTITEPYNPSFFDRFNIVVYAGAGYDPFVKTYTMNIGLGVGINLKKIF